MHDLRVYIHNVACMLEPDALKIVAMMVGRLQAGQAQYGVLNVKADPRKFRKEALEEVVDALVYVGAELIKEG